MGKGKVMVTLQPVEAESRVMSDSLHVGVRMRSSAPLHHAAAAWQHQQLSSSTWQE
jgi:hypothetical protein